MTRAVLILAALVLLALLVPRAVRAECGPYMPWDTVGQATCADLNEPPKPRQAPAYSDAVIEAYAASLAGALARLDADDRETERRAPAASPGFVVPIRPDGRSRSFSSFDSERGYTWGTVEMQPSGDYRTWDNVNGYRWGRVEVER
jgi:hypothetical protein